MLLHAVRKCSLSVFAVYNAERRERMSAYAPSFFVFRERESIQKIMDKSINIADAENL